MARTSRLRADALDALLAACRVTSGEGFSLDARPTRAPLPAGLDKASGEALTADGVTALSQLQETLYASASWAVLLVFQASDAAGKDGTIKHVLSGVNPQGVAVTAFKAPGPDELAHDFLWRIARALPARGTIGVFNRSHYEEVIVARVHPEVLARQRLPPALAEAPGFWDGRLADIAAFERHLAREGTLVLKFFLHVGREEQRRRLLARLDEPDKHWKFDPGDVAERTLWEQNRMATEAAIAATAAEHAPWYVVPADRKWLMRLLVVRAIVAALDGLGLRVPDATDARRSQLEAARRALRDEEP